MAIVNTPEQQEELDNIIRDNSDDQYSDLAAHISGLVEEWEDYRDTNYKTRWEEYYRLWRGMWSAEDKQRDQERSRLISPALQQAIEVAVAEEEEATFSRKRWFEIEDDVADNAKREAQKQQLEQIKAQIGNLPPEQQQTAAVQLEQAREKLDEDVGKYTRLLLEEYEMNGIPAAISECYLNGALYGTGIGKIVVDDVQEIQADGSPASRFAVNLVSVSPLQFAIDPAATTIDEALGCAHVMDVPYHTVLAKIASGHYRDVDIGPQTEQDEDLEDQEITDPESDTVNIIEYHGLVPREFLPVETEDDEVVVKFNFKRDGQKVPSDAVDPTDLVEVIVTIANDSEVLRVVENPLTKKDRAFIAFQHETVPNTFWGRGVSEKGYNSQKGLDAELRARIDGLALATYPMLAIDATRLPRGGDYKVRPGRNILTNGDPASAIREFKFTPPSSMSFNQTAEFERMVQMGTGSMDSATPIGVSPRNQTMGGMSMISAGAMKRTKRTMQNIERQFLDRLIEKSLWRYMQFDPERFPARDFKFKVHSTMGIMAREMEQQQLTNLLQTVPAGTPPYWLIMKSLYTNSSIDAKDEALPLIEQMLQNSLNPKPPPPDPKVELEKAKLQLEEKKHNDLMEIERAKLEQKNVELVQSQQKVFSEAKNKEAEGIKFVAQAEAEELGSQMSLYESTVKGLGNGSET